MLWDASLPQMLVTLNAISLDHFISLASWKILFVDLLNLINLYYQGKTSPSSSGRMYVNRAQEVVTSMLARGSAIRQEAVNKAKAFDEKHQFTANASAKVISFDRRVGFTEKLTVGISVVNEKVKSVDQRLHVSDKTMAAIFAAERKINDTGSAVKTSRYGVFFLN